MKGPRPRDRMCVCGCYADRYLLCSVLPNRRFYFTTRLEECQCRTMPSLYSLKNSTKFVNQISEEVGYQITDPMQSIGWVSSAEFRGTLDLVWTCVFTLFTCLWASLHLNIPAPEDTEYTKFCRKLKWTCVAATLPEVVVGTAFVNWWDTRHDARIMRKYDFSNWDRKLCAFVRMGGVCLRGEADHDNTNVPLPTVLAQGEAAPFICVETDILRRLIQEGSLRQDCLTHKMVDEKSKSDWFVKLVGCCQTLYFGLQCAGRLGMGLPLTTLEISTAILAVYALIIQFLWWNKPVDVAMPIVFAISQPAFDRVVRLYKPNMPRGPYRKEYQYKKYGTVVDITSLRRIPNDFSVTGGLNLGLTTYPALLSSLLFGGPHCFTWNLYFPSEPERVIWRISCVVMVAIPLLSIILNILQSRCEWFSEGLKQVKAMLIIMALYVVARLYLLLEGFFYLRAAPAACYEGVDWVSFVPHVG
ncbi:hypothetical protein F4818DRAFT_432572 [Hypoxylon cercidicola]|nr:hypothetical protein F4818DRAFT_432572 [Hypoxylon cercidicola]